MRSPRSRAATCCAGPAWLAVVGLVAAAAPALAGGTPENALLIVDPASKDALYVSNYYGNARNLPDKNYLYFRPGAPNYDSFSNNNVPALFGYLNTANIADHIDYIVIPPGSPFFIDAPGYVSDTCSPVTRFSISAAYTLAFNSALIQTRTLSSGVTNRYYSSNDTARALDSNLAYYTGTPINIPSAQHYFIGAMLGFHSDLGNSLEETIQMIDRSVAADGTRPTQTFYYMETDDPARSDPRDGAFDTAVASIASFGGVAQHLLGVLPVGHHDCAGIMTGYAYPGIATADIGITGGAFCDHLTSFAGMFDNTPQEKMSRWIARGASGSWGTVEEPCNYAGKFPHPRVHVFYFQGLSLGEAALRSIAYYPFQGLLYGDPLTRAFSYIPDVDVLSPPQGPVSGNVLLHVTAATAHPTATIAGYEIHVDGVRVGALGPGANGTYVLDTRLFTDGYHDLRVLAWDSTNVKSTGRWVGSLLAANSGQEVSLAAAPLSGDWNTPFVFDIDALGAPADEVRLVHNGRVVAAAGGSSATLTVYGATLGAGPVRVIAEARYPGGRIVRSEPQMLDIAFDGDAPTLAPPVAFGYSKRVPVGQAVTVELPATVSDPDDPLAFVIESPPQRATLAAGFNGAFQLVRPNAGATGVDTLRFHVHSSTRGDSASATVKLIYSIIPGDTNCDGVVDNSDIDGFIAALLSPDGYNAAHPACTIDTADTNGDGVVDNTDIDSFVALLID